MPRQSRGARLYLKAERRDAGGVVTHVATWEIRDGEHRQSTAALKQTLQEQRRRLSDISTASTRPRRASPNVIPLR